MAQNLKTFFDKKTILVTGGAGSIGSELVRHLVKNYSPRAVRVFDSNETALFELEQEFGVGNSPIRLFVGDVRDRDRLRMAMDGADLVFHAAALKHVYLNEYTPAEAVKTNVLGTQNVIDMALEKNVERVINISTDKAVDPTSVMGTTKLLAEKLTTAANGQRGSRRTVFASVRFGNVLASRGSVLPLFVSQIRKGGPVTVTDPKMTRFFMTIPAAVSLILEATARASGGELFILRMPSMKIGDLAEAVVEKYAPRLGRKSSDIKIKVIGARKGEKMHESLLTEHERLFARMSGGLICIHPEILSRHGTVPAPEGRPADWVEDALVSSRTNNLSKAEVRKMLDEGEG